MQVRCEKVKVIFIQIQCSKDKSIVYVSQDDVKIQFFIMINNKLNSTELCFISISEWECGVNKSNVSSVQFQ